MLPGRKTPKTNQPAGTAASTSTTTATTILVFCHALHFENAIMNRVCVLFLGAPCRVPGAASVGPGQGCLERTGHASMGY